jgi:hypothetical protein
LVEIPTAPAKESGAPIITVPQAKVRLIEPEFHPEPREIDNPKTGKTFTIDPGLNAQIEIVDDMDDGTYDGIRFYQNFRLLWSDENQRWELRAGGSLGALVNAFVKTRTGKPFDFDSGKPFNFNIDEWQDFEFMTKVVPKKNPTTKQEVGSMCHHETIMAIPDPTKKKKGNGVKQAQKEAKEGAEVELSAEDEAQMKEALGDN